MYTTTDEFAELIYTGQLTLRPGNNAEAPGEARWLPANASGVTLTPSTVRVRVRGCSGRELLAFTQTANRGHGIYDALGRVAEVVVPPKMREAPVSIDDLAPDPAYLLWQCSLRMSRGESPTAEPDGEPTPEAD